MSNTKTLSRDRWANAWCVSDNLPAALRTSRRLKLDKDREGTRLGETSKRHEGTVIVEGSQTRPPPAPVKRLERGVIQVDNRSLQELSAPEVKNLDYANAQFIL